MENFISLWWGNLRDFLTSSTWLQQLEAILVILGIPIAAIRLFFYRPRHKIYFKAKERDAYQEVIVTNIPGKPWSYWIHGFVKNKGFGESKKAQCFLVKVWKKTEIGEFKILEDFKNAVPLKWAHEARVEAINMLPRLTRKVDIGSVKENDNIFYVETEPVGPSGTNRGIFGPGEYLMKIVVTSENAIFPDTLILEIKWSGVYREISANSTSFIYKYILGKIYLLKNQILLLFKIIKDFSPWTN